jgi:phosphate-selective porin OprO/OprP
MPRGTPILVLLVLSLVPPAASAAKSWQLGSWTAEYGADGLFLRSGGGRIELHPQLRFQTRASYPFSSDPLSTADFDDPPGADVTLKRSRAKLGATLGAEWIRFYTEYEFRGNRLLTLRASLEKYEAIRLRVGQWKPPYNRERRDSSGSQQFAERSIVNYYFTIDRQRGGMVYGRLWPGSGHDTSWWAGAYEGGGRGQRGDGGQPMVMGRLQWNVFGRVLPFSQSDIERRGEPAASLAIAGVTNTGRYTRFSSSGGGELPGFAPGGDNQYRVKQGVAEAALHYRGFSFQAEAHYKHIDDRLTDDVTRLYGGYAEAGFFPEELWPVFPSPLELAARVAVVDPDTSQSDDNHNEVSIAANWFFNGHRNKLTLDGSWLRVDDPYGAESDVRVRLQWDVSF